MPACKMALTALGLFAAIAILVPLSASASPAAAPGFRYWKVQDTAQAPKTLSALGLYKDIAAKKKILVDNAWRYEVNSPLWSDDAKKARWVLLKPGASIGFREKDDYWDYPDSTVFVKDFDIDTIPGDTTSRIHWETRLLVNSKEVYDQNKGTVIDQWYGFTYKWDADQKEARLVGPGAQDDSIRIWPQGRGKPSKMKKWVFPARSQCENCHSTSQSDSVHGRSILGFFTAQLNRPLADSAAVNQLDYFFSRGVLRGQKPFIWDYSPRWRDLDDNTASLDLRARSYIAANCSGCHGRRGMENGSSFGVSLNYDFHTLEAQMDLRHRSVSWPFGLDTLAPFFYPKNAAYNPTRSDSLPIVPAVIVPGYPQKSVLLFRQRSRNTRPGDYDPERNQMPPLASFEVNEKATALIEKWILEMPESRPVPTGTARLHAMAGGDAYFQGGNLILSQELARTQAKVSMVSVNGREVPLTRMAGGVYAVPGGMPKGLYFIRIGARSLLRYLL